MDQYLSSHIKDLLINSKRKNEAQYSSFLTLEEQEEITSVALQHRDIAFVFLPKVENDRKILFVYPSYLGIEEAIEESKPISLLHICPKSEKFASSISHHDVLGALMGLGIKREAIGDIIIHDKEAYVYALTSIATEIERSLSQIKSNNVLIKKVDSLLCPYSVQYEEATYQVASIRLDAIISELFNLSREESKSAIKCALVKMSKHASIKADMEPIENEAISMRGKGKFIYLGEKGKSRKGKSIILVKKPQ